MTLCEEELEAFDVCQVQVDRVRERYARAAGTSPIPCGRRFV
ncbi:MAG: hypothetical protein ACLVJ6_01515 [Merdibacter sp.]